MTDTAQVCLEAIQHLLHPLENTSTRALDKCNMIEGLMQGEINTPPPGSQTPNAHI